MSKCHIVGNRMSWLINVSDLMDQIKLNTVITPNQVSTSLVGSVQTSPSQAKGTKSTSFLMNEVDLVPLVWFVQTCTNVFIFHKQRNVIQVY